MPEHASFNAVNYRQANNITAFSYFCCFIEGSVIAAATAFVFFCFSVFIWYLASYASDKLPANYYFGDALFGPCAFVGIMGILPCLMLVQESLSCCNSTRNDGKSQEGSNHGIFDNDIDFSVENSSNSFGSMCRLFCPFPSFISIPGCRSLYTAHFVDSVGESTWELVLALVTMQLFVNSLLPAALMVLFARTSVGFLGGWFEKCLDNVNHLKAIKVLAFLKRLSLIVCTLILFSLFFNFSSNDAIFDSVPTNKSESQNGHFGSRLKGPWLSDWVIDPAIEIVFSRIPPRWTLSLKANFSLLLLANTLAALAGSVRAELVRKAWVKAVVSNSDSNQTFNKIDKSDTEPFCNMESNSFREDFLYNDDGSEYSRKNGMNEKFMESEKINLLDNDDELVSPKQMKYGTLDDAGSQTSGRSNFSSCLSYTPKFRASILSLSSANAASSSFHKYRPERFSREMHSSMSRTSGIINFVAALLLGIIMNISMDADMAAFMALETVFLWQMLSLLLELVCFRAVSRVIAALNTSSVAPNFDPSTAYLTPSNALFPKSMKNHLKSCFKELRIVVNSKFFLVIVSYSLLSATILDCGMVSLSYLRWRNVPAGLLGFLVAFRYLSCGFISFVKHIRRRTGSLATSALLVLWVVWVTMCPAALAFAIFGFSKTSTLILLFAILISKPLLHANSFLHVKLFREWVETNDAASLNKAESSLQLALLILMHCAVVVVQDPMNYSLLVYGSVFACSSSLFLYVLWYRINDASTPFQIVDDIGQVVLVVR